MEFFIAYFNHNTCLEFIEIYTIVNEQNYHIVRVIGIYMCETTNVYFNVRNKRLS